MRVGMLWFDNDQKRTLEEKLRRAVAHYQAKYGIYPTICYVHPAMLFGASVSAAEVDVRGSNMILPNHFWLGTEEEVERRTAA